MPFDPGKSSFLCVLIAAAAVPKFIILYPTEQQNNTGSVHTHKFVSGRGSKDERKNGSAVHLTSPDICVLFLSCAPVIDDETLKGLTSKGHPRETRKHLELPSGDCLLTPRYPVMSTAASDRRWACRPPKSKSNFRFQFPVDVRKPARKRNDPSILITCFFIQPLTLYVFFCALFLLLNSLAKIVGEKRIRARPEI